MRGTYRDLTEDNEKLDDLKDNLGKKLRQNLELFPANIFDEATIMRATYGCKYIIHTAAPYPITSPSYEEHMIAPAVNGTLIVCKAAYKCKVKRLVITSSLAANMYGHPRDHTNISPNDWT